MADDKTYDEWTDVLGQTIRPGDTVAYASINGRSPQLVIARVERINKVDSRGEPIKDSYYDRVAGKYVARVSCSYTVRPVLDARDFYRGDRAVTLKIPENVIRVDITPKSKQEIAKDGVLDILKDLA